MTLSVVIVNYNVRFFLEQCLESVYASVVDTQNGRLELEVIVVDNDSADDSLEMLSSRFPQVKVIANKQNVGFAKANNQALRIAKGEYLLLLNPDTLVEKDTFVRCVDFMSTHPDCGALGVKMVDGKGRYLKESKRGFPTPEASFYKISGLIKLFPHSKRIAAYYMGHLPDDENNAVEVLAGAFIMTTRLALDKVGLLDESYFMYGEDIDFSWRFIEAGYHNYYLADTRIIHYKGESTKKGSLNYVYTFYNAMAIFSKKYFSSKNARVYNAMIQLAIWGRAAMGMVKRVVQKLALPLVDAVVAYVGFVAIKQLWATYWAENVNYYPSEYTILVLPLYIALLLFMVWLSGGYDKPLKIWRIAKGIGLGLAILLVFYSLLDETQRYSRAILVMGSTFTMLSVIFIRFILGALGVEGYTRKKKKVSVLVGLQDERTRVEQLYNEIEQHRNELKHLDAKDLRHLPDLIKLYNADEVIFCGRDVTTAEIIDSISKRHSRDVEYKIVPSESDYVVGSNSISSREDLYSEQLNTIDTPINRRNKRIFDIVSSLVLLILSPVLIWFQRNKRRYYSNVVAVMVGRKTWVSSASGSAKEGGMKLGVFHPADIDIKTSCIDRQQVAIRYARNYHLSTDINILCKNITKI